MYDFQKGSHSPAQDAEREKAAYDGLLAKYAALRQAADEGVFLITIQTERGTITAPVSFHDGAQIAITLAERPADWVGHIERALNYSLEAVGDELRLDRKEEDAKRRQRSADAATERAADERRELASAAVAQASQPQPLKRPVGRPSRKATATLGQAAAAVPMNGTSQQPTGKASSTPQG